MCVYFREMIDNGTLSEIASRSGHLYRLRKIELTKTIQNLICQTSINNLTRPVFYIFLFFLILFYFLINYFNPRWNRPKCKN